MVCTYPAWSVCIGGEQGVDPVAISSKAVVRMPCASAHHAALTILLPMALMVRSTTLRTINRSRSTDYQLTAGWTGQLKHPNEPLLAATALTPLCRPKDCCVLLCG